jgi:hypothetical protein
VEGFPRPEKHEYARIKIESPFVRLARLDYDARSVCEKHYPDVQVFCDLISQSRKVFATTPDLEWTCSFSNLPNRNDTAHGR